MKPNIKLSFIFSALVTVDQIAKNTFSNYICNKNIAWNIQIIPAIFYLAWIVIVSALIHVLVKTKNNWQKIFLVLILSGSISNIIDRLRLGCVVDYIDLKFWPVFNLADIYITVGVLLLILSVSKIPITKHQ